jgi:murein endopeptidase
LPAAIEEKKDVDARDKCGHDVENWFATTEYRSKNKQGASRRPVHRDACWEDQAE